MIFLKEQQANRHRYRKLQFQECLDAAFLDAEHGEFLYAAFCGDRKTVDDLLPRFAFPSTLIVEDNFHKSTRKHISAENNNDDDNDEKNVVALDAKDFVHFANISALFQYMRKSLESSTSTTTLCSPTVDNAEKKHCCSMCGFVAKDNKEFALHFSTVYGKCFVLSSIFVL